MLGKLIFAVVGVALLVVRGDMLTPLLGKCEVADVAGRVRLLFCPQLWRSSVRASVPVCCRRGVGSGGRLGGGAVQLEGGDPFRDAEPVPAQQSKVRGW